MQRLSRACERGAVAVIVAVSLTVVMAVAALAIDVSGMHADRQRLQIGADAAALAAAQDCAKRRCDLAPESVRAMAVANFTPETLGDLEVLDTQSGTIRVKTSAEREHSFAPLLGVSRTRLAATATAKWGYPVGGTPVLPVIFNACELEAQVGVKLTRSTGGDVIRIEIPPGKGTVAVAFAKKSGTGCPGNQSSNFIPGGFGWIQQPLGCGQLRVRVDDRVDSKTGDSSICDSDFARWLGKTVLLPIFDRSGQNGSLGWYEVAGYVAFVLEGYAFPGTSGGLVPKGCGSSSPCLIGTFRNAAELQSDHIQFSPSGPDFGVAVVALTG